MNSRSVFTHSSGKWSNPIDINTTELRGRVVDTPASYSGGPEFKYWPGHRLSWLRFSWFFCPCRRIELNVRPWPLLSKSFPSFHLSPFHSTLHSLCYWKSVDDKIKINKWNKQQQRIILASTPRTFKWSFSFRLFNRNFVCISYLFHEWLSFSFVLLY
jgi:hypothetical protein